MKLKSRKIARSLNLPQQTLNLIHYLLLLQVPPATRTQPPISQPNDQLASTSSSNQNPVYNPNERLSKGPMLLLGDSMIRGIQQRKFAPNRYVNKETIAGGTREISQYINHMQERNDYDYIVIHSGTNDVGKLTANKIRTNMENCLVNLKYKWPNSTIAISGLTYVPRDNTKNQLIEINCHYQSICTDLSVTFIENKRVTCDNYGNLIEQVLGISAWRCTAGTLDPLTYTRASSAEFCYPILE